MNDAVLYIFNSCYSNAILKYKANFKCIVLKRTMLDINLRFVSHAFINAHIARCAIYFVNFELIFLQIPFLSLYVAPNLLWCNVLDKLVRHLVQSDISDTYILFVC